MTIKKVLIANRGEIASRVIRTAREMDIATVAVFSDPDAGLPYVAAADEAVHLPGSTPGETYLRGEMIIEAAMRTGADAIHPGYGFLSENADFARACAAAGITFVGPTPEAIDKMGSKVAAKELMAAAGVPVLPGATIADEDDPDENALTAIGAQIGYPLLVKAAFGGGGRGMRIVHSAGELVESISSARREAASAFGNGMVFLERFVESPRHIEVQIFGDTRGTVVHLFERECSIQRRYQKIVEEAPSPAVDPELREQLCKAAVAAGEAIGYVGAGTVEFVLDAQREFFFLEVNTRLQVEHPVTEFITQLDLVRLQLDVAAGKPLPPEAVNATIHGSAIEVRLYAEDVTGGYLPVSGDILTLEFPELPGLRVDAGFASGTTVSTFYDSMLAKVIAGAPTRDQARTLLAAALDETRVHGIITNRDLLVGILREPDFASGAINTSYLDQHSPASLMATLDTAALQVHLLAAALAAQAENRATALVLETLPSGWRNNPSYWQNLAGTVDGEECRVEYLFSHDGLKARVDGAEIEGITLYAATPDSVDIAVGGVRRTATVVRARQAHYVDSPLGATTLLEAERFPDPADAVTPGSLLAPMPGTVVRLEVAVGDKVERGTTILAIEAMKMEHAISAPAAGIVAEIRVVPGQQVDSGALLAVLADDEAAGE
ncbi:MAG TPA: biotin carboxylase N-terminal domain-containing protein [Jatrophihabitans sp.]|jgi:acetyl/propionyl-CoA carboxylase alpha subunit